MSRLVETEKLRKLWTRLRARLNLGVPLLALHPKSVLVLLGWNRSFRMRQAVNRAGEPIPWYSYACTYFLEKRLNQNLRVFEYGCGNSTRFYAKRVQVVTAVEHNLQWAEKVSEVLPPNGCVIARQQKDEYLSEILHHGKFDVVVIDGIYRAESVSLALPALTPAGVILWDNSDRPEFSAGFRALQQEGFREVPFYGLGPTSFMPFRTSVLYRDQNCLGI